MDSNGVAPMSDPLVQQQMAAKYPARVKEIPARVLKGQAVPNFRGLRKGLDTRRRRRSAGCGGLRGEFLRVVGEQLEAEHMRLLEDWAQRFLQGELPPWFYEVWLSIQTVPLYKSSRQDTIRPIGIQNPLFKLINGLMIKENEPELVAFLEPQQPAMSPGGAAKLVHCTRMMMEREQIRHETKETAEEQGELGPFQEEEVGFKMDVAHAFNCCAGHSVVTSGDH